MLCSSLSAPRFIVLFFTIVILSTTSTQQTYAKPAGKEVCSCEGTMQFTSGGQSRFILKAFYNEDSDDEQVRLYFMLPGKTGLLPVVDIDFDDDTMYVAAGRKKQIFEGTIGNSPLKFKGSLKMFEGVFTLDLKRLTDQ